MSTLVEAEVLDSSHGNESVPARIRRFYTTTYKSLDQFDQLWYEVSYDKRDRHWETNYAWALVLDCFINARSAWCEVARKSEPMKSFLDSVVGEIREFTSSL